MLRGMLAALAGDDGIDPDDEKTIHYIENARDVEPKDQCEKLMELCCMVAALQPDPDHEFEFDAASPSARPSSAKAEHKLEFDSQGGSSCGASPPSAKVLSKGDVGDSTSGGEPLWLSIAKGEKVINEASFAAAGGTGASGTRMIQPNWTYVDIEWLVKIKTDSQGDVHYDKWKQPQGESERTVLTKPKILTVPITLREVERRNAPTRYVLSAADYQRLLDAVKD